MTTSLYPCQGPLFYGDDAYSLPFEYHSPDDFLNFDETENNSRNVTESSKKSASAEEHTETSRDFFGIRTMPVQHIHKPAFQLSHTSLTLNRPPLELFDCATMYTSEERKRVAPPVQYPIISSYEAMAQSSSIGQSSTTMQSPSTVTAPTPPLSPSDEFDFDALALDSIISTLPQELIGQERGLPSYDDILSDLHNVSTSEEAAISLPNPPTVEDFEPTNSETSDLLNLGTYSLYSGLPCLEASPNDLHMGEPSDFGVYGHLKNVDALWSWGSRDYSVNTSSVKVRNASGNSDCVVAKPSPIRCLDEEYEHLPETPTSDVDVEDVDVLNEELPVGQVDSILNASVKREHNYCEKKPSPYAFLDAESDDDSEVRVVKIGRAPQSSKKQFKLIYKTNTRATASKKDQKPARIIFKPFGSKLSIGLSPENIPTTNSPEVKQTLLQSMQESMTNKFTRKILKVSKINQSGPVAPPVINAPKCEVDPLRLNSADRDLSVPSTPGQTRGKPDAYTKRIRDQHSETIKKAPKRRKTSGTKEDDTEKRLEHNCMERRRRVNIRDLFEELKSQVPSIQGDRKASKVCILTEARNYINGLKVYEENLRLHSRLKELKSLSNSRGNSF